MIVLRWNDFFVTILKYFMVVNLVNFIVELVKIPLNVRISHIRRFWKFMNDSSLDRGNRTSLEHLHAWIRLKFRKRLDFSIVPYLFITKFYFAKFHATILHMICAKLHRCCSHSLPGSSWSNFQTLLTISGALADAGWITRLFLAFGGARFTISAIQSLMVRLMGQFSKSWARTSFG